MAQRPEDRNPPKMDANTLYREEIFTDRKIGTLRKLTPVKIDGSPDAGRKVVYMGEAHAMTPMGTLPLSFEIEAQSLEEAVAKYPEGLKQTLERTSQELQELRRQAASSIVVPQAGQVGPGGIPGGGKIQLR